MVIYAPLGHAQSDSAGTLSPVNVTGSAINDGYVSEVSVGGKEPVSPREVPQSVSVITEERIKDQNLVTVTDALNQVTGVTAISNDTTQSQFLSRGYALGVTYDGVPAYNALAGYQQFDLAAYERVEVLRGPNGVFAGSGNPGGTVNLVRKRAKSEFAVSGAASAGSWNNYRGEVDVTGPLNEDKTLRGRAVVALQDRDYFYDKTHSTKWLGYGTLEWDLDPDTTLSLAVTSQDDKTDAPSSGLPAWTTGGLIDAPRSTNAIADWSVYKWNTQETVVDLEHRFANRWSARVKLGYRDQDFYFKDGYASTGVDPATNTLSYARRVRDYNYKRKAVDVYATGPFTLFGREHTALFGYNYEDLTSTYAGANGTAVTGVIFGQNIPNFDVPYNLGGETRTAQSGIYGQARLSIADPLTVLVGGRFSDFTTRSRNIAPATQTDWSYGAKADNEFTPYAGVIYDLTRNVNLYASYTDIFIPQTQTKVNGETLDPRVGRQFEIGSKSEFLDGKLNVSVAIFNLLDKNRPFADPDNTGYYLSSGEVQSKGFEVEVSGSPAPGYQLQAGYTRLKTEYKKDAANQGLPFDTWEPRDTLKLWGVRKFSGGLLDRVTLGLGANLYSSSTAGNGTSAVRRQDGYAVVNLMAGYQIDPHLSLALNLNNLFDETYYTRLGGTNTYNTYGEPRNVSLTLRATY